MKNRTFWLFLALIPAFTFAGNVWPDNEKEPCTIMQPDRETLKRWIQDYESAPKAYINEELVLAIPVKGSHSLLSHLQYIPAERNQGSCGNCWAWAGTGVMGIELDVEEGILDRLSIQYLNSCDGTGPDYLINANRDAVSEVVNGNEGVIYNTDEIVSFLEAYAKKSPPGLKILANMVRKEMLKKQRQGKVSYS